VSILEVLKFYSGRISLLQIGLSDVPFLTSCSGSVVHSFMALFMDCDLYSQQMQHNLIRIYILLTAVVPYPL